MHVLMAGVVSLGLHAKSEEPEQSEQSECGQQGTAVDRDVDLYQKSEENTISRSLYLTTHNSPTAS